MSTGATTAEEMARRARDQKVGLLTTSSERGLGCLGIGVLLGLGSACHAETPSLAMAETNSVGTDELPPAEDSSEPDAKGEPATRSLWFEDGPGREAILARERRDHEAALEQLEILLAMEELAPADRAAGELLMALEQLRRDEWIPAADRLERARAEPALAPVEPQLRLLEAQARLDGADAAAALALVDGLDPNPKTGVSARVLLVKADALARTNERAGAIAAYREFLAEAEGQDRHEATRKLAVLLVEGDQSDKADKREAAKLFESLVEEVPLSDYGQEAEAKLAKLEKAKLVERSKAERRRLARRKALAEAEHLLSSRSYRSVIAAADTFIKRARSLGADEGDRCQVLYFKGSAMFKQRKRSAAAPVFDRATKHCVKAGRKTLEVKSRYQAARGVYAAGHYAKAAARFEDLAADHADHSYADDCWIKAGESWESAGEPAKARKAYQSSLARHPKGDMAGEALRRLLVQAFAEGRIQDALDLTEEAIAAGRTHGDALAKLHYFRGKALDRLGRSDEAEAAWLEVLATRPLSYPALQAMSRLRERGEASVEAGLERVGESARASLPKLDLPPGAAAERVEIWASLGLGERAQAELDAAGIEGWPAVAALARAGLYSEAQRKLASLGSSWRHSGPGGGLRRLWELAHPVPFFSLVHPGEQRHGVPELLTYAIMQSESRFNPGATSWAGARGLIQLMPATAKHVAARAGLELRPRELYDPATNLDLGQRYLAGLTARWGNVDGCAALAVPSYNAGPGRTDDWIAERGSWDLDLWIEAIPFDETRKYTQSVLGRWAAYRWLYAKGEDTERIPYVPLQIPPRKE